MVKGKWEMENGTRGAMTMTERVRLTAQTGIGLAMAVALTGCSYNTFTTQEEAIKAQWAQV